MGYEEASKVYRAHDIEAGQAVISRDVNFDESIFGLLMLISGDDVSDLDLESFDLDDEDARPSYFQQTGKLKNRPSHEDNDASYTDQCADDPDWKKQVHQTTGLRVKLMKMKE